MNLYKTLYPIKGLGLTIPPNTIVRLDFRTRHQPCFGYFEFLGAYVGLTKLINMSDVTPYELEGRCSESLMEHQYRTQGLQIH